MLARLDCVSAYGVASEPVGANGPALHLEGAVPFAVALPARSGAGPEPATVRQLVYEAHEALYVGLIERHATIHAGSVASLSGW